MNTDAPKHEGRFFFVEPSKALNSGLQQVPEGCSVGSALFDKCDPDSLRQIAVRLIGHNEQFLLKGTTHCLLVDIGINKQRGGLGAGTPDDTVIIFRPA